MNRIHCPACGWFGFKARRQNRRAEDAAHIAWAAALAHDTPERSADR